MLRFGLCCIFKKEPIAFKRTTAKYLKKYQRSEQLLYLSSIIKNNALALFEALVFCNHNGIGDFRINSRILPLKTHPDIEYSIDELPECENILILFKKCGDYAIEQNIRTTFHPDQFILLSSPSEIVTKNSIEELIYQTEVAAWINSDVINIHAGGAYGNKKEALERLKKRINKLPDRIKKILTLENDDKIYSPADLLPVCRETSIPFVYDVHHHRCLSEFSDVEKTTELAFKTWSREPLFHISSPKYGWQSNNKHIHSDYIDIADFPCCWLDLDITIEVEAKSKEFAVLELMQNIESKIRKKQEN